MQIFKGRGFSSQIGPMSVFVVAPYLINHNYFRLSPFVMGQIFSGNKNSIHSLHNSLGLKFVCENVTRYHNSLPCFVYRFHETISQHNFYLTNDYPKYTYFIRRKNPENPTKLVPLLLCCRHTHCQHKNP